MDQMNDNVILLGGESATGKSASLMNLRDHAGVMYLNCDAGKKLPFPNRFRNFTIEDPFQVHEAFDAIKEGKVTGIHTVIIDTLTFLFDMFESKYIVNAADGQKAWAMFQQFGKVLFQDKIATCPANVIVIAHTLANLNEDKGLFEVKIPVKGALKNTGIEAYFTINVSSKKVPIKKLEGFENDMLTITDEERALGFKYVFQTKLTKETTQERMRGPIGLFKTNETYIDNDMQKLLDHVHNYYNAK